MKNFLCLAILCGVVLINAGQSIAAGPDEPSGPLYDAVKRAQAAFSEGDYETAEKACLQAIHLRPDFYLPYTLLGIMYADQDGRDEEAIMCLEQSLQRAPDQSVVYNQLSFLYREIDALDQAIACLEAGLKRFPSDSHLNFSLGLTYLLELNDADTALTYLLKADKLDPKSGKVIFLTGFAYFLVGKQEESLQSITRLRRLNEELMATNLEAIIRQVQEGRSVDVEGAMQASPAPVVPPAQQGDVSFVGNAQGTTTFTVPVTVQPSVTTSLQGSGQVEVTTHYSQKEPQKVQKESVGLSPLFNNNQ